MKYFIFYIHKGMYVHICIYVWMNVCMYVTGQFLPRKAINLSSHGLHDGINEKSIQFKEEVDSRDKFRLVKTACRDICVEWPRGFQCPTMPLGWISNYSFSLFWMEYFMGRKRAVLNPERLLLKPGSH